MLYKLNTVRLFLKSELLIPNVPEMALITRLSGIFILPTVFWISSFKAFLNASFPPITLLLWLASHSMYRSSFSLIISKSISINLFSDKFLFNSLLIFLLIFDKLKPFVGSLSASKEYKKLATSSGWLKENKETFLSAIILPSFISFDSE